MKIGTTDIKKIFLGNNEISKAFLGNSKVYEKQSAEWILEVDNPTGWSCTCTSADKTFGAKIYWLNGVQYKYEFDWELTEVVGGTSTQIALRDANTQSKNFVSGRNHYVGQTGHTDEIITSNRERNREVLITKYYDGQWTIKVTNFKLYRHV